MGRKVTRQSKAPDAPQPQLVFKADETVVALSTSSGIALHPASIARSQLLSNICCSAHAPGKAPLPLTGAALLKWLEYVQPEQLQPHSQTPSVDTLRASSLKSMPSPSARRLSQPDWTPLQICL